VDIPGSYLVFFAKPITIQKNTSFHSIYTTLRHSDNLCQKPFYTVLQLSSNNIILKRRAHLSSQYSGGQGRRVANSRPTAFFFFKFCLGNRASRWRLESLGHTVEVETCKGKGKGGNSSGIWKLKSKQE
jgi:hypothetical protein